MSTAKKNTERENIVRGLFSGNLLLNDVISKRWKYLLFLVVLALSYITFHYLMADTVRHVRRVEREVQNLRAEYATKASKLMQMSKQSEVSRMLREREITTVAAPKTPPKRIKGTKNN